MIRGLLERLARRWARRLLRRHFEFGYRLGFAEGNKECCLNLERMPVEVQGDHGGGRLQMTDVNGDPSWQSFDAISLQIKEQMRHERIVSEF
jgi:hypothetical protein